MRYSIMLQLVTSIALVLVATAAFFSWLQSRPSPTENTTKDSVLNYYFSSQVRPLI